MTISDLKVGKEYEIIINSGEKLWKGRFLRPAIFNAGLFGVVYEVFDFGDRRYKHEKTLRIPARNIIKEVE